MTSSLPYIIYMSIYDTNYMYHTPVLYVTAPYKAMRWTFDPYLDMFYHI
jgi:hypothetical protein